MTELKTAKQILLAFLLKQGKHYDGKSYWTGEHRRWLKDIKSQLKMYICGGIKMYNYSAKATQSLSL